MWWNTVSVFASFSLNNKIIAFWPAWTITSVLWPGVVNVLAHDLKLSSLFIIFLKTKFLPTANMREVVSHPVKACTNSIMVDFWDPNRFFSLFMWYILLWSCCILSNQKYRSRLLFSLKWCSSRISKSVSSPMTVVDCSWEVSVTRCVQHSAPHFLQPFADDVDQLALCWRANLFSLEVKVF